MARESRFSSVRLWALTSLLISGSALALGLGDIQVESRLNQSFSAVIPLTTDSTSDLNGISVSLGSASEFRNAGIQQTDTLSSLRFTVDTQGGRPSIIVKSSRVVRAPYLNFLVRVQWNGGTLLREYTVLMNPPDNGAQATPTQAAAPPAPNSEPADDAPVESNLSAKEPPPPIQVPPSRVARSEQLAAPRAAPTRTKTDNREADSDTGNGADIAGGTIYGPVKAGETFWSIAKRARPDAGVTMDQVLLSIYMANRGAFDQSRFNGLKKNSALSIPSAASMRATSAAEARSKVQALRRGHVPAASAAIRRQATETTPVAPAPATPKTPIKASPEATSNAPSQAASEPSTQAQAEPAQTPQPSVAPSTPTASAFNSKGSGSAALTQPTISAEKSGSAAPMSAASAAQRYAPATAASTAAAVTAPGTPQAQESPPPTPSVTTQVVATQPQQVRQSTFMQRWRGFIVAFLALVVVALLIALVLRRRKRNDGDGEPELQPRAPVGPARKAVPTSDSTPVEQDVTLVRPDGVSPATSSGLEDIVPSAGSNPVEPESRQASLSDGGAAFDATVEGDARSVEIDASDGEDPVSEADFHLAYGLYDEAIQLLQRAVAASPQRKDLKLKLADSYAAAGKPVEYQELAEQLQNEVSMQEWVHIAEKGRKLCPGAALFEPVTRVAPRPPAVVPADLASPVAAQRPPPEQTPGDNIIDFDPTPTRSTPPQTKTETPSVPDLRNFDSFGERPSSGQRSSDHELDFNLDDLDLSEPDVAPPTPTPVATPQAGDSAAPSAADDEFATKLDLARAYSDMGDNEAARSLLEEVLQGGSATLRDEAEALARKLAD